MPPDFATEYAALTTGIGLVNFHDRTQIELTGADRVAFLHNFTTNDIRHLKPGEGCEAFALDVRGHTIGHLFVFCTPDSVVIDTVAGQAEKLVRHFDKYLIRDQVEIHDRTEDWSEQLLSGLEAEQLLHQLVESVPAHQFGHQPVRLAGQPVWLRRVGLAGPNSFLIAGPADAVDAVAITLAAEGVIGCRSTTFDTLRIEAGFPWYGVDITDKNLPQEVDRNKQAISFTKGCYLGQETVARIDALGHVNKLLRCLKFSASAVPLPGAQLRAGEAAVGEVTSAAFSPLLGCPVALAYVRSGHDVIGTYLDADVGRAEVIMPPRRAT
ncbi:MAG TPA: glycine cleavage T C-terminal barrel domain-containing protein [Pirellulales bacterium]|nr:glycine cleavage T C-terminal barrel domain-containing protein [Pirellulales bacterium]